MLSAARVSRIQIHCTFSFAGQNLTSTKIAGARNDTKIEGQLTMMDVTKVADTTHMSYTHLGPLTIQQKSTG